MGFIGVSLAGCQHLAGQLSHLGPAPEQPSHFQDDTSQVVVGQRLLAEGESEAALKAFNRAMIDDGVSEDVLVGAAAANSRLGRLNLARKLLVRAAQVYPNSAAARNNLGVIYYQLGDYPRARAAFNAAFALSSGLRSEIAQNIGILDIAEERVAKQTVEVEAPDYYVVPQGGGVFKLVQAEDTSS